MKTPKTKSPVKKPAGNPFDLALLRLGHHLMPQPVLTEAVIFDDIKKS
jgi:hypothetical protein